MQKDIQLPGAVTKLCAGLADVEVADLSNPSISIVNLEESSTFTEGFGWLHVQFRGRWMPCPVTEEWRGVQSPNGR